MKQNPNMLIMYEHRPYGSNYTPRDLIANHVRNNPHLYKQGQAYWDGRYEVTCQGRVYQYDHWKIEPDPETKTERITLFLTECRKEN